MRTAQPRQGKFGVLLVTAASTLLALPAGVVRPARGGPPFADAPVVRPSVPPVSPAAASTAPALSDVAPTTAPVPGDQELAQRLGDLAQSLPRQKVVLAPTWQLAGVLMEAAGRLDPDDPRYPRLAYEAFSESHDSDAALRSLQSLRALDRDDRGAQLRLIDLYLARFQTAEARLEYCKKVLGVSSVPEEIRSYAAQKAADVCLERGEKDEAVEFVKQSLQLNPVNLQALRMRYALVAAGGSPLERVTTLLAMLKANPAQIVIIDKLAQELADAGLVLPAIKIYSIGGAVAPRLGLPIPRDYALNYVIELLIANQPEAISQARGVVDQVVNLNPNDLEALMLRALVEKDAASQEAKAPPLPERPKALGDPLAGIGEPAPKEQPKPPTAKDALARTTQLALNAGVNRLAAVRRALGVESPTTREASNQSPINWPDFADDVKRFEEPGKEGLKAQYASVLVDLAWCEIFFAQRPDDAKPVVDALKQLGGDDAVVARLEGWGFLVRNERDSAKVKLSAVKDRDPLAAMGAIRLAAEEKQDAAKTTADAQALFSAHPAGLVAAFLWEGLKDYGIEQQPKPYAGPILEEYSSFPLSWFGILDQPQSFYTLKGKPAKIAHKFGEPIYGTITIENTSEYDITVGPDGVIQPGVWFDAQIRGIIQQPVQGSSYERLSQQVVLHPKSKGNSILTQTVRLDQGELAQRMAANPAPAMEVMFSLRTNPSTNTQSGVGPAGYGVLFDLMIGRSSFPVSDSTLKGLSDTLSTGSAADKVRALDMTNSLVTLFAASKDNPQAQQMALRFFDQIRRGTGDAAPAVQTWAAYLWLGRINEANERTQLIGDRLLKDKLWHKRLIGLMLCYTTMPLEYQKTKGAELAQSDPDPTVRRAAQALSEAAETLQSMLVAPATGPSAGPATGESPAPAAALPMPVPGEPAPPAPLTPAPLTPAPLTPAPLTPAPLTPAPSTGVPPATPESDLVRPPARVPAATPPVTPPEPATKEAAPASAPAAPVRALPPPRLLEPDMLDRKR